VLCILPYEVARQRGYFAAEGLDVNLVYMRGGTQAMNALLAGSVDWVGTPIDLVIQTVAKGKDAIMIASTSRLPFFALVAGPRASNMRSVKDLAGQKIGVGNLGTTDHLMAQYLLTKEGVDPASVEFVALGPNLYEQLARGQVEAGMVQEPSLTLVERAGGRVLVNFMRLEDTQRFLGGPYQFMGLNTRPDVLATKADTGRKLARALARANRWMLENPGAAIVQAAPDELVAGGEVELFAAALDRYKQDLYPADGRLVLDSIQRVIEVQQQSGAIEPGQTVRPDQVFTNQYLEA
jgi:NitT/TauT family transport system substrate-binding protein